MKNLFILPTNKPSRLFYNVGGKLLYTNYENYNGVNTYITNSDVIKDGDYGLCVGLADEGYLSYQVVFKMDVDQRIAMEELGGQEKARVLKVILTNDSELIKDGVQSIPDEFIQWLINNQTCESVEVERDCREIGNHLGGVVIQYGDYEIIIPKEEIPNPINNIREKIEGLRKQESLEEAAENYSEGWGNNDDKESFMEGAKWEREQSKKLFTKEELLEHLNILLFMKSSVIDLYTDESNCITDKWFEQFK